jgi:hypothetical protein
MAAAANGAEAMPEVLVTTDEWSFGEELEFWRLMMPRSQSRVDGRSGGGMAGLSMDAVAERARWNVQHDARLDYRSAAQLNAQGQDLRMLRLLSPINQFGLGESILTAASGIGSTVVAGFADLVTGDPGFGQYLQEEWTYQPRFEIGRDVLSTLGAAASPLVSGLEYSRGELGDFGYSLTGSPSVAAALYTAPDAALTLLAPEARMAFGSVGGGLFDGSTVVARYFGESLFDGPMSGSLASQRGTLNLDLFGRGGNVPSTSGLDWSRTSPRTGGNAAEHVTQNHGQLSLSKPDQGVFYANPVIVAEEAWQTAQTSGLQPISVGSRDIYVVPRANSGYAGGMGGQRQNFDHVTIITEKGTNRVVTSYPSGGTPPLPKGYIPFAEN